MLDSLIVDDSTKLFTKLVLNCFIGHIVIFHTPNFLALHLRYPQFSTDLPNMFDWLNVFRQNSL